MTFDFHPAAEAEFKDAVAFYKEHAEDLGLDFAAEVREAIDRAIVMPLAWIQIEPGIRSAGASFPVRCFVCEE